VIEKKMEKTVAIVIAAMMTLFIATSALPLPACAAPDDNQYVRGAKHIKVPQSAPLNPEFKADRVNPHETFYGYIRPPTDLGHLDQLPIEGLLRAYALPDSFDWRDYGSVTPVKNQGSCGTCWIFGTTAVLESAVHVGESAEYDFSEQSVALCVDRSWVYLYDDTTDPCLAGGWGWLASEAFIRKGSVLESCNPYNTLDLRCDGSCACDDCLAIKKVDGYRLATNDGSEIDVIKNAVYDHGPVTVAFYYTSSGVYSDGPWGTIYDYYPCSGGANHLVSIVGWNDSVPHPDPNHEGTGAWIVKNSWGPGWGNDGFFYLAYDSSCVTEVAYLTYKDDNPGEELLYWDEAGHVNSAGYRDTSAWMASVFTVASPGVLTHVDFWTTSNNAQYEIYVWDGFFGSEIVSQTGSCQEYGYYSIPLSSPIPMTAGQEFTVGVKMTTPGYNYPIPFECKISGTVDPPIQSGVSFIRHESNSWQDLGAYGWNACLRARMVSEVPENNPPDVPTNPVPANGAANVELSPTLSVDVTDADGDTMTVSFYEQSGGLIGTDTVAVSGTATTTWSDANQYSTTYYWYTVADDSKDQTTSPTWSFTTEEEPNQLPTCTLTANPSSGEAPLTTTFSMSAYDPDGTIASWELDVDNDGTAEYSGSGVPPAEQQHTYNDPAVYIANLTVWDNEGAPSYDTTEITVTQPNNPPGTPTNPVPANGAADVELSPALSVDVTDADGDTMMVSFYEQSGGLIGTDTVAASGTATTTWTNANQYSTTYSWYTVADDSKDQTTSPTWSFTTEEEPSEIVEFFDSFEVSEWNYLWVEDRQNDWFRSKQRATDGSYSAEVDGYATNATLTMVNPVDLSGKASARLTFSWYIERSWDRGEFLALDIYDGTWHEVRRLTGDGDSENVWHHETIDLSPYLVDNFKIRFRAKVSSSSEDGNVDNVKITSYVE
jgi:C1A family cysteine protease/PKD repeat protein